MRTMLAAVAASALVLSAASPALAASEPTATATTDADASVVILVNGEDAHLVDALAVTPLVLYSYGDLQLVSDDGISAAVKARVASADTVYVIGGTDAISAATLQVAADAAPDADVVRLGGADRYETSLAISAEVDSILGLDVSVG